MQFDRYPPDSWNCKWTNQTWKAGGMRDRLRPLNSDSSGPSPRKNFIDLHRPLRPPYLNSASNCNLTCFQLYLLMDTIGLCLPAWSSVSLKLLTLKGCNHRACPSPLSALLTYVWVPPCYHPPPLGAMASGTIWSGVVDCCGVTSTASHLQQPPWIGILVHCLLVSQELHALNEGMVPSWIINVYFGLADTMDTISGEIVYHLWA